MCGDYEKYKNSGLLISKDKFIQEVNMKSEEEAFCLLNDCFTSGKLIDCLPKQLRPTSYEQAYSIQSKYDERSTSRIGWKIAATSKAGQAHIGVNEPLIGRLNSKMVVKHGRPVSLWSNRMKVAEAEFVFKFEKNISPRKRPYEHDEVNDLISDLYLGLEFPNSRFNDFATVGFLSLIADNACAHQFMLGPVVPEIWRDMKLSCHSVKGIVSDSKIYNGTGANVLGDPKKALLWFVNEASKYNITINAGEIVTTGTCTIPMPIAPKDKLVVDFGKLGSMSCDIIV